MSLLCHFPFGFKSVITLCDVCVIVVYCAKTFMCVGAFASVSVFVCVQITRDSKTKRVGVDGFVCCESSGATHMLNLGARDESMSLIKV